MRDIPLFRYPVSVVFILVTWGATSYPQTSADFAEARKLFADALHDEEQSLFQTALEKFQRVREVRDTAPVRYRIGTCFEGLGHLKRALEEYQKAVQLGAADANSADVVQGAQDRIREISGRVAYLTLTFNDPTADLELSLDGEKMSVRASGGAVSTLVDPGRHVVLATAPNAPPFRTELVLPEGGRATVAVPALHTEPSNAARNASRAPDSHGESASATKLPGLVLIGTGIVLTAAATVTLVMRHNDISDLNQNCPGGICPAAREDDLRSVHSRAVVEGPLALTFGGLGLAALAVGAYWTWKAGQPNSRTSLSMTPVVSINAALLSAHGTF